MSMTARQMQILDFLNQRTFMTVEELAQLTFTSPSSIRRDLTRMQNIGCVVRTHGGVSLPAPLHRVASFHDRTHRNIKEKRSIAKKASALLQDGQTILLDSSSTSAFMLPHIAERKNICVFTNHLSTAIQAIELGIDTHCLGGHSLNGSGALSGPETYRALSDLRADLLFFSSQSLDQNGCISDSTEEENFVRSCMLQAAAATVFLCDSGKFDQRSLYRLANLNDIDFTVFDQPYNGLTTTSVLL